MRPGKAEEAAPGAMWTTTVPGTIPQGNALALSAAVTWRCSGLLPPSKTYVPPEANAAGTSASATPTAERRSGKRVNMLVHCVGDASRCEDAPTGMPAVAVVRDPYDRDGRCTRKTGYASHL